MKYLFLLYSDPAADAALGPDGRAAMVEEQVPRSPGLVVQLSPIAGT